MAKGLGIRMSKDQGNQRSQRNLPQSFKWCVFLFFPVCHIGVISRFHGQLFTTRVVYFMSHPTVLGFFFVL